MSKEQKAQAVAVKGEILHFVSDLYELGNDILENAEHDGNDAELLLDTLDMSIEDLSDILARDIMRYQELKATGSLRANERAESARFVEAAKTLLKSSGVPDLIHSARRLLNASPESLVERIAELGERADTVARASRVVLKRQKKLPLDAGDSETEI